VDEIKVLSWRWGLARLKCTYALLMFMSGVAVLESRRLSMEMV